MQAAEKGGFILARWRAVEAEAREKGRGIRGAEYGGVMVRTWLVADYVMIWC